MELKADRGSKALAWGRVLRLSLAPSAVADVAAGLFVGGWGVFPPLARVAALLAASACVYHGGMALNDWVDREHDAATRPERPLPSGALSPASVRATGFALLLLGIGLAASVSWMAASWVAGMAALVLAYDFGPRGAASGPLLLGACRAANLALGLLWASTLADDATSILPRAWWLLPLLYGAYVFCASKVARLEDRPDDRPPGHVARGFALAATALLVTPALVNVHAERVSSVDRASLALALLAAWAPLRSALATRDWTRAECGRFTGLALRRLLVFTALCALSHRGAGGDGWLVAALILAGFPVAAALRSVFPPT